jgi:general nucleoside transport system permease protein
MLSEFFTATIIISVLASTLRIATPLLLAALGELVTERAGVMNLGVEGTMLIGAFAGFYVGYSSGSLGLGYIAALVAGGVMSLFMVFMAATLKVDQTVTGLSINLLASGLTLFIYRVRFTDINNLPTIVPTGKTPIPLLSEIPYIGDIFFNQNWLTYFALIMVPLVTIFIYKTKYGLAIRAIGENPRAADTVGWNVTKFQYFCVIFGGMMSGLGGAFITIGSLPNFLPDLIAGRGWLAVILVIAGNWQPIWIFIATLIFGFLDAIQLQLQGIGVPVPHQLLLALPFIIALLVLTGSRVRSMAPKNLAKPYIR